MGDDPAIRGEMVGWVYVRPVLLPPGTIGLGFDVGLPFRRRGYALEASRALLAHARLTCGLGSVTARADVENSASISLLAKLGFVELHRGEADGRGFVALERTLGGTG